jgi:hypothetical protein
MDFLGDLLRERHDAKSRGGDACERKVVFAARPLGVIEYDIPNTDIQMKFGKDATIQEHFHEKPRAPSRRRVELLLRRANVDAEVISQVSCRCFLKLFPQFSDHFLGTIGARAFDQSQIYVFRCPRFHSIPDFQAVASLHDPWRTLIRKQPRQKPVESHKPPESLQFGLSF